MTEWATRFKLDEAASVAELVNLALQAAGCSISVDVDDIRDPDNASGRLSTIQDEFQAVSSSSHWTVNRTMLTYSTAKRSRLPTYCQRQRHPDFSKAPDQVLSKRHQQLSCGRFVGI